MTLRSRSWPERCVVCMIDKDDALTWDDLGTRVRAGMEMCARHADSFDRLVAAGRIVEQQSVAT